MAGINGKMNGMAEIIAENVSSIEEVKLKEPFSERYLFFVIYEFMFY